MGLCCISDARRKTRRGRPPSRGRCHPSPGLGTLVDCRGRQMQVGVSRRFTCWPQGRLEAVDERFSALNPKPVHVRSHPCRYFEAGFFAHCLHSLECKTLQTQRVSERFSQISAKGLGQLWSSRMTCATASSNTLAYLKAHENW